MLAVALTMSLNCMRWSCGLVNTRRCQGLRVLQLVPLALAKLLFSWDRQCVKSVLLLVSRHYSDMGASGHVGFTESSYLRVTRQYY